MKLFAFFLLSLSFLDAKTVSRTQVIMSTFITITTDKRDADLITEGFEIIKEVERSISSYDPKAKIYRLNKDGHTELDGFSYEALRLSRYYYEQTEGYFDITVGSITKDLYRFGEDERVASKKELLDANVNFSLLTFNKKEAFLKEGVKIDLGGMGKGYAVDKAARYFRSRGVQEAVIAASGDIRCLASCKIAVQDPFNTDASLFSFKTARDDLGVSTSGNYNRYILSKTNNHLIDPKARRAQSAFISVTLIGALPNSDLDAYATAASVMPPDRSYGFLKRLEVGYIVMQSDKKIVISRNISRYVNDLLKGDAVKKQP